MILKFRAVLVRGLVPIPAQALVELRDALLTCRRGVVGMVPQGLHLRRGSLGFRSLQERLLVRSKIEPGSLGFCSVRKPVDLEGPLDRLARHAKAAGGFAGAALITSTLDDATFRNRPILGQFPLPRDPDPLGHQPSAFDLADLPAVQVFGYLREATIRFATFVSVHRRHLKPVDAFPFELNCSFKPAPPILIWQPFRTNRELRSTPIVLSPSKIAA